jgi:WD40 repeat protein/biotin carboxyl carrier protein
MRRIIGVGAVLGLVSVTLWWTRLGSARTDGAPRAELPAPSTSTLPVPPASASAVVGFAGTSSGRPLFDPVVVGPCNLTPLEEQDVSSQVEGTIRDVHAELGQRVAAGEILAHLDDRLLRPQVDLLKIKAASESARLIAKAQLDDFQSKLVTAQALLTKKAMAREEYHSLQCQRDRFAEEVKKALEEQTMASKELEKAQQTLELHQIRSALAGEVTKVYKRAGESVRQIEPLFCVAKLDRLRVEGLCKVQQASLLQVGMRAIVEPEQRGEQITTLSGHTGTVTALALSADGRVLASASEDRGVRLWNVAQRRHQAVLHHPAEVYAVAFAPAADSAAYRLLSGSADGRVRCWLVPTVGGATEPNLWPGSHEGAIRSLTCSQDGKWCATGGEDRRIGLWDLATGKLLYWVNVQEEGLEVAHRGAVTMVAFTPDGHLLSAGRDNTLKVWKLGAETAALVAHQSGRSGDAAHLGMSPDGRRVLFDHGEELRLLDWSDWSSQGALRSRRQGRFHAFATFSPSGRLILTAGNNGQLQLWTAPALPQEVSFFRQGYVLGFRRDALVGLGGLASLALERSEGREGTRRPQLWQLDGYELRHYLQPSPGTLTCGLFAADESMIFSAGADCTIHVWAVPRAEQWRAPLEAVVTYVGSQVERGTDMVRIRAELENPAERGRRLRPGTSAHLRLYPETAPAPKQ